MAVCLLPVFALALFIGTVVEFRHDAVLAQEFVYRAWWFLALLVMLGVNILFAAIKKRPWQRHQLGFLITHLGLLTLVAGGMINGLAGKHGSMYLVDADTPLAASFGMHSMDFMIDRSVEVIQAKRAQSANKVCRSERSSGVNKSGSNNDALTTFLACLAHPWHQDWELDLGEGARLQVLEYAAARQQPYSPAPANGPGFPALRLQLTSSETGPLPPRWLASHPTQRSVRIGPGLIEFLGQQCRPKQLEEFTKPPVSMTGNQGLLVLGLAGRTHRFDVAQCLGQDAMPLKDSEWRLRLTRYLPNYHQADDPRASNPALSLELSRSGVAPMAFALPARQAGLMFPMNASARPAALPADLWHWYHPADFRYADASLRAVLQFVTDQEGKLYYRSFSSSGGKGFSFEGTGRVRKDKHRIWPGMNWKFQVQDFLPHALARPCFVPDRNAPSLETSEVSPALRCRLSRADSATEFWIGKTAGSFLPVELAGEEFLVGYHAAVQPLGFSLTLARAEQTTDPGSAQPASQTSYIYLNDAERGLYQQPRTITLNQPLFHRGYRVYQSAYDSLGLDQAGKPVSRSILTVRNDPGLYLKYAGSGMVALGIACMFYMRAYFLKRAS